MRAQTHTQTHTHTATHPPVCQVWKGKIHLYSCLCYVLRKLKYTMLWNTLQREISSPRTFCITFNQKGIYKNSYLYLLCKLLNEILIASFSADELNWIMLYLSGSLFIYVLMPKYIYIILYLCICIVYIIEASCWYFPIEGGQAEEKRERRRKKPDLCKVL